MAGDARIGLDAASPPAPRDAWWIGLVGLPLALCGALMVLALLPLLLLLGPPTALWARGRAPTIGA